MCRYYILQSVNIKDGRIIVLTAYPDTHTHVCTIKSKNTEYTHRRLVIKECTPPTNRGITWHG